MKKPTIDGIKGGVSSGLAFAKQHGGPIATQVVDTGRAALKTRFGKRIATGAAAGGAIAFAVPFMAISTGAILGAGTLILFKALQDKEPE